MEHALNDDPRPGAPPKFDDSIKAHIVAVVCSKPEEGFDRWTLDLLKEHLENKGIVESISRESLRLILREHDLKPWQQASWCVPELNEEYVSRMEEILDLYAAPYNALRPMVCLDEKPIVPHEDVREPEGLSPGKCRKVDYEYKRNGTANAFCIVEPKCGHYTINITDTRKADDFAQQLEQIAERYADAEKIDLVMDNLNTHCRKSLVSLFGEEKADQIWERFEVHYTPKHGSWLNQAEIAINMYARQCLGKTRIPTKEILLKKSAQWARYINEKKAVIKWKFSKNDARKKFNYQRKN